MSLYQRSIDRLKMSDWDLPVPRPVLAAPISLGAGILVYFALSVEPGLPLMVVAMAGFLSGLVLALKSADRPAVAFMAFVLSLGALGFLAAKTRTVHVTAPVLTRETGPVWVEGRIERLESRESGLRVTLAEPRIDRLAGFETPSRVRLSLRAGGEQLLPGDWARFRASLSPPPGPVAPGAFDFQRRAFFEGIGAVGFAYGQGEVTHRPVEPGWRAGLQALRQDLTGRIMAGLPGETGTIAAALMTGERRAIPGETLDAIRDSGLAHLLAISGLHIGLVTALLFGGLRLLFCLSPGLAERWPAKKLAAALALPGALAYALIAGATVPSLRAFLMVAVVLTAVLLDRRGISMRNVAIAAFLLLLAMPESLLGPSFQMSFAAVTALVAAYEVLQAKGWWPTGQRVQQRGQGGWLRRAGTYLAGVAISTLIAGLATAPFAAFHFNRVADFSLLANLAAVPVTALWTMPSALAAFILMPLGWEGPALAVMGAGIEVMTAIARWVADLPGAVTLVPAMPGWSLVLLTAGSFWLLAARGVARSLGPVTIAASLALALATPKPDLLIDAKGRLIGLNDGLGFQVSSLSTARFERDVWLGRLATAEAGKFPRDGANGGLRCDIAACRWVTPYGTSVALIRHPAALAEDCRSARLVISLERVPTDCRRLTRVIDKGDIRAKGATAVYLRWDGSIRIETDRERRGDRPWVALPAPHQPRSTAW